VTYFNNPADTFDILAGTNLASTDAYDTSPHVITAAFNGASSSIEVSGGTKTTGDAGSQSWDYGSVAMALDGTDGMRGYIAQLVVFDRELNETEIVQMQEYLTDRFEL